MADMVPTRGRALALAEERRFLEAGFDFLDEKRMLLAAALLAELAAWRAARDAYAAAMRAATAALKRAVARHGLEGMALYPSAPGHGEGFATRPRNFLGLGLLAPPVPPPDWRVPPPPPAVDASALAEAARAGFAALPPLALALALRVANIDRLIREFRATERRARALENVILPETRAQLAAITEYLDEFDQEEAVQIRNAAR